MCNLKPPPEQQTSARAHSGFETKHRNTCGHSLPLPPPPPPLTLSALFLSQLHNLPSPPVLCSVCSVWLWSSSFFFFATGKNNKTQLKEGNTVKHNTIEHGAGVLQTADSRTNKSTWTDEAEERIVGGQTVVPLKSPVRATTRPLDGQHLWLHRTLPGVRTGQQLFWDQHILSYSCTFKPLKDVLH